MTTATALTSAKNRLDILNTDLTFDTQLTDYSSQAVNRLFPRAGAEVPFQTVTIAPDIYGEVFIDLSGLTTPISDVRLVEFSGAGALSPADNKYLHGTSLRLRDVPSWATSARVYGLNPYTISTVPASLELAVIWYMMAEFYENLAGNKRKFNIYMQNTGVSAMSEMRQEAQFYEQKADMYVDEQAPMYGSQ